jgi:hypothetical protein
MVVCITKYKRNKLASRGVMVFQPTSFPGYLLMGVRSCGVVFLQTRVRTDLVLTDRSIMNGHRYCYVINYAPETGNPVTGYKSGMFRDITNKSWASTQFTMRTTRIADWSWKIGENCPEYGKWYTIFQLIVYSYVNNENNEINEKKTTKPD